MISKAREDKVLRMLHQRLESVTVVLEAVYLRHNISAILRSAEAFGVHDVHLITKQRVIETGVARGAERWVNINKHTDTATCLQDLKNKGFRIYVADLADDAHTPITLPVDEPIAIVMGTELEGVSEIAKQYADGFVIVPMRGVTQSLNVSVACGCILFQVAERRRALIGAGDLSSTRQEKFFQEWKASEIKKKKGIIARQSIDQRVDGKD